MEIIKTPPIKYEDKVTFKGIPEDQYYETINSINEKLRKEARKDAIAKHKSEEVARHFFVGPTLDIPTKKTDKERGL